MPAIRGQDSKKKTRRYTRDIDQVYADQHSERHLQQHLETKASDDLPAGGQYYCVECAKFFESEHNFAEHRRGKNHKRRLRQLRDEPYSHKEADAAVGFRTDNGKRSTAADKAQEALASAIQTMEVKEALS